MSDSNKIKLTVLPTETMHADLSWLLINPANMTTKDQPVKQRDWVEVPPMSSISSTPAEKLIWGSGVPRDYLPGPDVRSATCWVLRVGLQRDV
jgi:N-acyl homoserine lactone hydrolase